MYQNDSTDGPDDLLLFAPVPTTYRGANGWTSEVQRAFVGALARCGTVAAAARSVGRSPSSAYQLRRRAGDDSPFARAWDEAQRRACEEALDAAMAGGMVARRTEVFYRGRHVGWRTAHDNRLGYAALRALDKLDGRWGVAGRDARMLLAEVTQLLNGRETCEASPPRPRSAAPRSIPPPAAETRPPRTAAPVVPRTPDNPSGSALIDWFAEQDRIKSLDKSRGRA